MKWWKKYEFYLRNKGSDGRRKSLREEEERAYERNVFWNHALQTKNGKSLKLLTNLERTNHQRTSGSIIQKTAENQSLTFS